MFQTILEAARQAHVAGSWDDALAHYQSALDEARATERPAEAADILRAMGELSRQRGDIDEARARFQESRAVAEGAGMRDRVAFAVNSLAVVHTSRGELNEALDLYLEVRVLAEELGDETLLAVLDQNLGIIANIQGNAAVALLSHRSALLRFRKLGNDRRSAQALNNMGMAHVDLGEWEAADRSFKEAGDLAHSTGELKMMGLVALNHTELHLKRRRYDHALRSVESSLEIFQRLRAKPSIAAAYKFYGVLYRNTAKARQADTHFGLALCIAEACGNPLLQAEIQLEWSILHLEEERREEGILYMNRALRNFRELKAGGQVFDIERRMDRLREVYVPAVRAFGAKRDGSGDAREGHEQRVADYATKLAREVGVEGWDLTWLHVGALLHNIGSVAGGERQRTPADDDDASARIRATLGEAMARQLEFPEEVRPIIRNHGEAWNGGGYPDRLAGEAIPFSARIVAIADVYDSLTRPRGFQTERSTEEALEIMGQDAGQRLDPRLQLVFRDLLQRGGLDG